MTQTAVLAAVFFVMVLSGCVRPADVGVVAASVGAIVPTPTLAPTISPTGTPAVTVMPVVTATPLPPTWTPPPQTPAPTPFFTGDRSPVCGQILPILPETAVSPTTTLQPDPAALLQVENQIPDAARAAWNHILAAPETVGLVAYRVGQEAAGVYLNADTPMPLGSVVKLVHLVAYAEAVGAGELDPTSLVPVSELEKYYQPGLDLGAHKRALAELEALGRVYGEPPAVQLEDIPWMMMRFSANTAMDYLHTLLGQARIEETAVSLGITTQTAPCPFLAQFLAMSNITRARGSDSAALQAYLADPALYAAEATLFADAFVQDPDFRAEQNAWRREARRPTFNTQRAFTEAFNPKAAAGEYAALMARLAQNGLSNPDSSFIARRYLEWPMIFADNQALFSNLGFKNGTMPGVINLVYYAYPQGEVTPVVVVLFFHDLPTHTYRQWRNTLTHDEFARWLLYDPEAITAVAAAIGE